MLFPGSSFWWLSRRKFVVMTVRQPHCGKYDVSSCVEKVSVIQSSNRIFRQRHDPGKSCLRLSIALVSLPKGFIKNQCAPACLSLLDVKVYFT